MRRGPGGRTDGSTHLDFHQADNVIDFLTMPSRDALRAVASGRNEQAANPFARLQQSVGRALGRLGLSAAPEHVLAEGYSVDYALVDERIAIEVDGPNHFAAHGAGAGRAELGNTIFKQRQLGALGGRR